MKSIHVPVMLEEVLGFIEGENKKILVDGTFGGGGHTQAILEKYPDLRVIGIDLDDDALERGEALKKRHPEKLSLHKGNYRDIDAFLKIEDVPAVDGVLLDLGISSDLVSDSGRGFSFQYDAPLDMRMDKTSGLTAGDVLNRYSKEDIARVFYEYGEERKSRQLAELVVQYRRKNKIQTTTELVELAKKAIRGRGRVHPATKVFQALRIEVNDELNSLSEFLKKSLSCLSCGGRVLIISFHSLEDRMVKNFFREREKEGSLKIITKKPIVPSFEETRRNPRSRSAKLRVAERVC
jgi:16S rRNA (cytosine1402-N4)-methyltransferase